MIELLRQQIADERDNLAKTNKLRETLQLLTLKFIQDKGYFNNLAFVGGTALRFLYDMRRFSEDLDFSVFDAKGYDFTDIVRVLEREFDLNGLKIETKPAVKKTVRSSMLKFPGLLKSTGLSPLASQTLSIKIKADSNSPCGWHLEKTLVNKLYALNISHFDLASLYAAKLHACFFRKYVKGRDFYDLLWYLGKKVKPNYQLLNNAITQTQGRDYKIDENNIMDFLTERVESVDFSAAKKDVERFLQDKSELKLLEKPIILKSIRDVFGNSLIK
ncbi:MAG: nucleotidyl transferase AbiEii/AbiGii toxin family protein [Candidatus Omnitrophota bacterium]